jgi:folate-binding protein YgfZ
LANKYFIKNIGLLKASGKDLIDFINRMSTNDFGKFPEDEFRKTVLTTDKGRIVDLINILNFSDQQLILTSNNFQDKIISHLDKYIIMDDVSLEKSNDKYFNIIITGDNLTELAKEIFSLNLDIEKNKVYKLTKDEFLFFLFIDDFKFDSLNIICKEESLEKFKDILKNFEQQSCEEYDYFRIVEGLPEGENEFNDQINPMECGLDKYISFTKGCYIGQEVIARLDSQGKRPKQMVKINSESILSKDDKIFTEDKEAGFISSAINVNGNNAALGFIRSVNLDFEKEYFVKNNKEEKIKINIS